jgi:hypothetical protein
MVTTSPPEIVPLKRTGMPKDVEFTEEERES